MSTVEFIVDNIYDSFINNNTCKLKFYFFLLSGLERCKDTQMKACDITQTTRRTVVCGTRCLHATCKLLAYRSRLT